MEGLLQLPYSATVRFMLASLERNLLPDAVIRRLSRLLLAGRLHSGYKASSELQLSDLLQFVHCTLLYPLSLPLLNESCSCFCCDLENFKSKVCMGKKIISFSNHVIGFG